MIEDVLVGVEHAVGEPVVAQELPEVLDWIEFRAFGRQCNDRDVWRYDEPVRQMPPGLIDEEYGVRAWRDFGGDFGEVQVHRPGVASRHDESCALALLRADGAEDIGRGRALIVRRRRAGAAFGPASCDLVLLPDARFIGEPDLYCSRIDALLARDRLQARGETFLKSSMAPSACA